MFYATRRNRDSSSTAGMVPNVCSAIVLLFSIVSLIRCECAIAYQSSSTRNVESTVVIAYHKPADIVTSHATVDIKNRKNVYQDIMSMKGYIGKEDDQLYTSTPEFQDVTGIRRPLHAIGRLDAETTGLLLLTNDGGLLHHVTNKNARSNTDHGLIRKTYEALIMGFHDNNSTIFDEMRRFGVDIGEKYGGMTRPVDDLTVLSHPTPKTTLVSVTISEGKNRQIRRMFHALNAGVIRLCRTRIGEFWI